MAKVHLSKLHKTYGEGPKAVEVIRDISVDIPDGEFVVMVGPSGCGKSTLLRMVAGLEEASSGQIIIGDRVVNQLEPKERDIAMVFQNYALYPHMSVYDNMAYGLRIRHLTKDQIETRVQKAATILELGALLQRTPRQLSGGQRQRVAMGRAIVREPAVFLFDEPLSNLDAKLRVQMRLELQRLHRALSTTSLYVTHDQVEAMTLGQRLIVMNAGRAEQIGTPTEVYDRPASMFVASFIGSPPMNLLHGTLSSDGSLFDAGEGVQVRLPQPQSVAANGACVLGIRPEHLTLGRPGLTIEVEMVEMLGADLLVHARIGTQVLVVRAPAANRVTVGERVMVGFDASAVHWFDPQTTLRLPWHADVSQITPFAN